MQLRRAPDRRANPMIDLAGLRAGQKTRQKGRKTARFGLKRPVPRRRNTTIAPGAAWKLSKGSDITIKDPPRDTLRDWDRQS
jgi:hypothetical protein